VRACASSDGNPIQPQEAEENTPTEEPSDETRVDELGSDKMTPPIGGQTEGDKPAPLEQEQEAEGSVTAEPQQHTAEAATTEPPSVEPCDHEPSTGGAAPAAPPGDQAAPGTTECEAVRPATTIQPQDEAVEDPLMDDLSDDEYRADDDKMVSLVSLGPGHDPSPAMTPKLSERSKAKATTEPEVRQQRPRRKCRS